MDNIFIGISGIIGAGKTTLATDLSKLLNIPVYYENVAENKYLADFYEDMKQYAFPLQIHLLNNRFRQHQQIIWEGKGGIQDRTIYEDQIFCNTLKESGIIKEKDFDTYIELFNNMSNFMKKPNFIIHLDVSAEESLKRIQARGRPMESGISIEYLEKLRKSYKIFLDEISKVIPVIQIDWNEFMSPEELVPILLEEMKHIQNIKHINKR